MVLDDKRILAIQMLIDGKYSKTEIAEKCGRSRQWLYDILEEEEVKAELEAGLQKIKLFGESLIKSNLEECIGNVVDMANNAKSEKTKLEANTYLIDRVLGKPTSKVDIDSDNQEVPEYVDPLADITEEEIMNLKLVK